MWRMNCWHLKSRYNVIVMAFPTGIMMVCSKVVHKTVEKWASDTFDVHQAVFVTGLHVRAGNN